MSAFVEHTLKLTLEVRRCAGCNRLYAFEYACGWRCGNCWHDTAEQRAADIKRLERANAALRGAIGRKARAKKEGR